MSPFGFLSGWALVALWFLAWQAGAKRRARGVGTAPPGSALVARLLMPMLEALLLTLFAAFWFASLGHGGWLLLFAVLGLLIEGAVRLRHATPPAGVPPTLDLAWCTSTVLGTLRLVVAGALLDWRL